MAPEITRVVTGLGQLAGKRRRAGRFGPADPHAAHGHRRCNCCQVGPPGDPDDRIGREGGCLPRRHEVKPHPTAKARTVQEHPVPLRENKGKGKKLRRTAGDDISDSSAGTICPWLSLLHSSLTAFGRLLRLHFVQRFWLLSGWGPRGRKASGPGRRACPPPVHRHRPMPSAAVFHRRRVLSISAPRSRGQNGR